MKKKTPSREIRTIDGRLIGFLRGAVLFKRVKASVHKFRKIGKNGAWGIDYDVLFTVLPKKGSIYIEEVEGPALYIVKNDVWREKGTVLHFKEGTKDHNVQVFLPIELFAIVRRP